MHIAHQVSHTDIPSNPYSEDLDILNIVYRINSKMNQLYKIYPSIYGIFDPHKSNNLIVYTVFD